MDPVLRHGRCPVCKTVYRWEDRDGLRLKDAVCKDCDVSLTQAKVNKAGPRRVEVIDVDAAWLRKGKG